MKEWNVIFYGEAKGVRVKGETIYIALLNVIAMGFRGRDISGIIAVREEGQ